MQNRVYTGVIAAAVAGVLLLGSCESKTTPKQEAAAKPKKEEPRLTLEQRQQRDRIRIDSLEQLVRQEVKQQKDPDIRLAMYAIQAYQYYAADYPQDTVVADYHFKSAQLYEGVLRDYKRAIEIYGQVYEKYPDYRKRPMALFLQGNLYHELQDNANAIRAFSEFKTQYPKHAFADDAEGMINYIRMDPGKRDKLFGGKGGTPELPKKEKRPV